MLNFVLCDDNINFLNSLENALNKLFLKYDFDSKIVFKSTKISDLLDYLQKNNVHVLFLDINLKSSMNGISVAEKIRQTNKDIYIIFITAYIEYVFLAFQVKAFDYLPKPLSPERLEASLLRLFDDIGSSSNNFICINNKTYIKEDDIYFIKRDGMKLVFATNYNNYEIYSSFKKFFPKLPDNFVRCHKSYIANINNITSVEANRNMITFSNNAECYIGPRYKNNFLEVINNENISK